MSEPGAAIGVIGGSGLYRMEGLQLDDTMNSAAARGMTGDPPTPV
jgi:hypothetical protein